MEVISHQTVRLSRGAHHAPARGMCVMELASVLAGERFCDRPTSVCPVIGALLRAYNDRIDDARRQDLIPYAARAADSRAGDAVRRERASRCVAWIDVHTPQGGSPWRRLARRWAYRTPESCGAAVAHAVRHPTDASHGAVLRLVDELIAMTEPDAARRPAKLTDSMLGAMLSEVAADAGRGAGSGRELPV